MKLLRGIGLALLFALLFGLMVGTALRQRMEAPERYLGLAAPLPFHVADSGPGVFEPRQDEQQVG